jgi:hypothetical protein
MRRRASPRPYGQAPRRIPPSSCRARRLLPQRSPNERATCSSSDCSMLMGGPLRPVILARPYGGRVSQRYPTCDSLVKAELGRHLGSLRSFLEASRPDTRDGIPRSCLAASSPFGSTRTPRLWRLRCDDRRPRRRREVPDGRDERARDRNATHLRPTSSYLIGRRGRNAHIGFLRVAGDRKRNARGPLISSRDTLWSEGSRGAK